MAKNQSSESTRRSLIQRVQRASERDIDSWEEFVALYDPLLLKYIGACNQRDRLGLNAHECEDIKQEVLIKLIRKLELFNIKRRFRTWLWQVTYHEVIDWMRSHYGCHKLPKGEAGLEGAPALLSPEPEVEEPRLKMTPLTAELEESLTAPVEQIIEDHKKYVLRKVLEKVKAEMQSSLKWKCFEQHYLEERASAEVGAELGITEGAVNINTARVRARILELCQDYDVELDG